eukprot:m.40329 g.40329  ORF g.40329 m.40329 type:complete len:191 (-) comp5958_c0_seq1:220-792(-)
MAGGGSKAARGGVARASKQLPNPRSEVVRLTERREMLKRDLDILEQQIADFEGSYLKTSPYGNAIKGWRATTASAGDAATGITTDDLIFSNSSVSWVKKRRLEADPAGPSQASDGKATTASATASAAGSASKQREATDGAATATPVKSKTAKGKGRATEVPMDDDQDDHDGVSDEDEGPARRRTTRSQRS